MSAKMRVLISDPDNSWTKSLSEHLSGQGLDCDIASSGKDCQLKTYKNNYDCLVLDLKTKDHTSLEVLKYTRLNHLSISVLLTSDKEGFDNLGLSKEELKKLGARDIILKPAKPETIVRSLTGERQFAAWRELSETPSKADETAFTANDGEFTRIKIDTFLSGNISIFDHYIRLSVNSYIKIVNKGEVLDPSRIRHFIDEKKIEYLYFRTADRGTYINFINAFLESALKSEGNAEMKLGLMKNAVEKYVEEIYFKGVQPHNLAEGKILCNNMYNFVQREPGLRNVLSKYEDFAGSEMNHLFLTSILSVIICKDLDWTTSRTVETIVLGSLLHEIGKVRIPKHISNIDEDKMTIEELVVFRRYPELGVGMLQNCDGIKESILQIVFQHRESCNGNGFPLQLSANKIYPPAKIVSLADAFSSLMIKYKLNPLEALRIFLPDRQMTEKFEAAHIKALVKGLLRKEE